MRLLRRALLPLVAVAGLSLPLAAQEADDGLGSLRNKGALTDEDRATLRTWFTERVVAVAGEDRAAAQQAFNQLRTGAQGSAVFQDAYVTTYVEVVGRGLKKWPLVPASRLITILGDLNDVRVLDATLEALGDERTAVRAAAAVTLRKLQVKLAANAGMFGRALSALRDAGKQESSAKTLELIYRALDYSGGSAATERRAGAAALLEVLQSRAQQAGGAELRAEGADRVGLEIAGRLREALDTAAQAQYTRALGQLLHYGVRRYVSGENPLSKVSDKTSGVDAIGLRNNIELLIMAAEQQLTAILKPTETPLVTGKMQQAQYVDMVIEMNRWAALLKTATGLELPDVERPREAAAEEPAP